MAENERLARIEQKLDDFAKNTIGWLKKVEEQTKKTNGKVADIDKAQVLIKKTQDDCAARKYFTFPTKKDYTLIYAAGASSLLTGIIMFIMLTNLSAVSYVNFSYPSKLLILLRLIDNVYSGRDAIIYAVNNVLLSILASLYSL